VPWESNHRVTAASLIEPSGKLSIASPAMTPAMPSTPASGAAFVVFMVVLLVDPIRSDRR
jgi:hypothetical protein